MAEPIGALRVDLSANAAQFEKDMGRARRAVRDSTNNMKSSFDSFKTGVSSAVKSLLSLKAAALATAGATAFGYFTKKTLEAADAIAKTADSIGVTTDSLQEFRYAFNLMGIEQEALTGGLQAFNKRLGELRIGTGTLDTILKKLGDEGFRTALVGAKDTEAAFNVLLKRLANSKNAAEAAAIAGAALGRTLGAKFVTAVRSGSEEIDRLRQEARDLGLVIREDLLRGAEEANDRMTTLATILGVRMKSAVLELAPQIEMLAENMIKALPAIFDFIDRAGRALDLWDSPASQRMAEIAVEIRELQKQLKQYDNLDPQLLSQVLNFDPSNTIARINALRNEYNQLADQIKRNQLGGTKIDNIPPAGDVTDPGPDLEALKKRSSEFARAGRDIENDWITHLEEMKQRNEEFEESLVALGNSIRADIQTPLEAYNARVETLNTALNAGVISQTEFDRAVKKAGDTYKESDDKLKTMRETTRELGMTFTSAFEDAAVSGGKLSDILQGLEQDLLRLALRKTATEPLMNWFSSLDFGGFFGSAKGNVFSSGRIVPFARGGVVDKPTAFPLRNGTGLMGEAGAEAIMPLSRGPGGRLGIDATGAGSPVTVNVYAPEGSKVRTEENNGPGGRSIDVVIDEAVAKAISTSGSRAQRALRNTFSGLNKQLTGR